MLLYINKRLIEFKEDSILNITIVNKEDGINEYFLYKESKGFIFRDININPYRPHLPTAVMAINNALSNNQLVMQNDKPISSQILQIDKKFVIEE